jgi:hypothetical protein
MNSGNPEHDIARRLTAFEGAHPDIMVWKPIQSVSGTWEAQGDGWSLQDPNPSRFLERLLRLVSEDVGVPSAPASSGAQAAREEGQ